MCTGFVPCTHSSGLLRRSPSPAFILLLSVPCRSDLLHRLAGERGDATGPRGELESGGSSGGELDDGTAVVEAVRG